MRIVEITEIPNNEIDITAIPFDPNHLPISYQRLRYPIELKLGDTLLLTYQTDSLQNGIYKIDVLDLGLPHVLNQMIYEYVPILCLKRMFTPQEYSNIIAHIKYGDSDFEFYSANLYHTEGIISAIHFYQEQYDDLVYKLVKQIQSGTIKI